MFKKILIANRGEIACRVIKTCKKMGIKTVAVYSDADKDSLHAQMADEAVHIGAAPSAESYLLAEKIVAACKETGAEAVHPGYGFLSEKADFQRALAKEGITFIGPDAYAIDSMGDKITSKKFAQEAGVSTVPGHMSIIKDADEAVRIARDIVGYPVMLKASAGGGGKGMRLAWNDEEAHEGFISATNEAKTAFADDRVFIEKFIEDPRHIEIQVIADSHGNVIYLGERECSIQRRHQKVIEEAPSPLLTPEVRKSMGEQACALASAVKYKSAGTVEFIVAGKTSEFYFLEMNTRLQVEHPVTEMVTGVDLVEMMIRVAAGEKLSMTQDDVQLKGWAIEARIYAEDPFRNFLPSIGRLVHYVPPVENSHVRVDTGVYEGGEISMFYDPMIAKLIAYGQTRDSAIGHMREALDQYYIRGLSHNIPFLASLMCKEKFVKGDMTTGFIAEEYPDGLHLEDIPEDDPTVLIAVGAAIKCAIAIRNYEVSGRFSGHILEVPEEWTVILGGKYHDVEVRRAEAGYAVVVNGEVVQVKTDWKMEQPLFRGYVDGRFVCVQVDRDGVRYTLSHSGSRAVVIVLRRHVAAMYKLMPYKEPPDMSQFLLSPMPGLLKSVDVVEGQLVRAGEPLVVVEAMKMENIFRAERDSTVLKLLAQAGDSLAVDQKIIEFAPAEVES